MDKYGVRIIKPWLEKISASNECGTIVAFPRAGVTRIMSNSINGMGAFAGWGEVDASISGTNYQEFENDVADLADQALELGGSYVAISGLDLYRKSTLKKLKILSSLRVSLAKKINFVIVVTVDPNLVEKKIQSEFHEILLSNVLFVPYATQDLWLNLSESLQERFDRKLTDKEDEEIYYLSGGCPYLAKHLLKRLVDGKKLGVDDESLGWAENIVSKISKRWINWCKNLEIIDDSKRKMLMKLGVIDEKGGVRSELIGACLTNYETNLQIKLDENEDMWIEGTEIANNFSESEKNILKSLIKNKKVSRQEIANICWGENKSEEYSEYALDKLMSNLRKKILALGLSKNYLITIKGVGFRQNG